MAVPDTTLVVARDADYRRALATIIEARGCTVVEAPSAAAARERLARFEFAVLIVDADLEDGSGLDLLEGLSGDGREFAAVFTGTQWNELDAQQGRLDRLKVTQVFRRPFNLTLFADVVHRLAGVSAAPSPAVTTNEARGVVASSTLLGVGATETLSQMAPGYVHPLAVDPLIGARIGSFKVIRRLGSGGMGAVYLAEHPAIGSKVAIKVLHETDAANEEGVKRFFEEARLANLIQHDNIVRIIDLNLLPPNRYYIVMEHLDGITLATYAERYQVTPTLALEVLIQVCNALHAAHAQGVVHRDVKPDNIFLLHRDDAPPLVKLVDFGIAKLRAGGDAGVTRPGVIVGTPRYLSPEQCRVSPLDGRSDMYSLGLISYELAAGRSPFDATNPADLVLCHLHDEIPDPRVFNPSLNARWALATLKAVQRRAENRHENMAAFGAELRAALDETNAAKAGRAVPDLPQPGSAASTAAAAPDELEWPPQSTSGTLSIERPRSGNRLVVGIGAALLCVATGVVWLVATSPPPAPAPPAPSSATAAPPADSAPAPVVEDPPPPAPVTSEKPRAAAPRQPRRHVETPSPAPPTAAAVSTEMGRLTLQSKPWAAIRVDGKDTGMFTPIADMPLKPGRHTIELVNEKLGKRMTFTVDMAPGASMTRSHVLP